METKVGVICLGLLMGALGAGGSPLSAVANPSDQARGLQPIVRDSVRHDVLANLSAAPAPAAPTVASQEVQEVPKFPSKRQIAAPAAATRRGQPTAVTRSGPGRVSAPSLAIPGSSRAGAGPLLPAPVVNVEGIDRTDSPANRFLPPDTNGAAGADFYLQQVNVTFAVYNKVGQRVMGPTPQAALWAGFGGPCQTTGGGDGIVLYDRYANRFLFSKLAFPNGPAVGPFFQCISVSVTADPTGAWNRYQFLVSDTKFNDYPKFGVWPDGYYYTVNQFVNVRQPNERLAGVGAGVFERDKMLLGQRARLLLFDTEPLGLDIANMLPADADGPILPPAGSPNFLVNMKNMLLEDLESTIPQPVLQLWKLQVDWRQPQSSTFTGPDEIQTMDFDPIWNSDGCSDPMAFFPELCIPQPPAVGGLCTPNSCPNPDQKLDALQDRLMFRLQYRHSFDSTFGEFESLISNHTVNVGTDGVNRAGVHWWQLLQTPNKTWTVNQQDIIAPDDTDSRWMASAAMDEAENIVVGYTVSSPTRFPSVRYQGYDNGTIRRGETSLSDGTGAQGHPAGRWGDYSSMTLDPLDDCTFWYTQEYMRVTSRADWATRIGAFRFESCRQRNTR